MKHIRKILNIFMISLNSIFFRIGISILIIIMNTIGFYFIEINVGQMYKTSYRLIGSKKLIDGKKDRINLIRIDTLDDGSGKRNEDVEKLVEDINNRYDIFCTSIDDSSIPLTSKEIQTDFLNYIKENTPDVLQNPSRVNLSGISINPQIIDICNFDISWGNTEEFILNEEYTPIIIGYELDRYLNYGDEFLDVLGRKYKVVGCAKKDSRFFNSDILFGNIYSLDVNKSVIMAKEQRNYNTYLILYGRKLSVKEMSEITSIASMNNLVIKVDSIDGFVKGYTRSFIEDNKPVYTMTFFFIIIGMIGISSASCIAILTRKKDYGILYANGFSKREVGAIIYTENFIKLLVAGVTSYVFLSVTNFKEDSFIFQITDEIVIRRLHFGAYPAILMLLIVLFSLIATVMPIHIFKKQNIAKMIGGTR